MINPTINALTIKGHVTMKNTTKDVIVIKELLPMMNIVTMKNTMIMILEDTKEATKDLVRN